MNIEKIINRMAGVLNGESIYFDENYAPEQENRPILTLNGDAKWVDSVIITMKNDLLLYVADVERDTTELWALSPKDLAEMDSEQVEWLLHEMWYELPYECDICDWEDVWYELIEEQ